MPGSPRDTDRAAVYAAENQLMRLLDRSDQFPVVHVAGSAVALPVERHFGDLAGVQRYVDGVLGLEWVAERWPDRARVAITVRERRSAARAHYEVATATVAVPVRGAGAQWALREMVVLHEVAHHLGGADDLGHGAGFRKRLLELAEGLIGPEIALLLRVAWADQGLRPA